MYTINITKIGDRYIANVIDLLGNRVTRFTGYSTRDASRQASAWIGNGIASYGAQRRIQAGR